MYTIFKSTRQFKKYMAVFADSKKVVHFGDNRYGQYKDKTKLKLYSRLDHTLQTRGELPAVTDGGNAR